MTAVTPSSLKSVHIIGDSHALGFKGKSVSLPEYGLVVNTSVEYIRGLKADRLVHERQLLPDLTNYFLRNGIITKEGVKAAATTDSRLVAEQYATGFGFQRPLVMFVVGEIFIRKYIAAEFAKGDVNLSEAHGTFRQIIQKYVSDIAAIQGTFGLHAVIHEICPPTADDEAFEAINQVRCPRELRATLYEIYNKLLLEHAFKSGIAFCRSADYLSVNGLLSPEFEFDGVHADPKYAYTSLERSVSGWLHSRISEKSDRYLRWCEAVSQTYAPAITQLGVSDVLAPFEERQLADLRAAIGHFEGAVCRKPPLDWAHQPPTLGYGRYNDSITYGDISARGLRILHDVLIGGPVGETIRALFGARFSIINVRPVHSLPHAGDGIGQQSLHRDGCPPGVFRGLIYLTDVDGQNGPFEYVPPQPGSLPRQMTGRAGSLFVFDANAVAHRATPPRKGERIALDLIFMVQPEGCTEIADCRPGLTWPVDPYMFDVSESCYPPLKANRWFYPALVAPKRPAQPVPAAEEAVPVARRAS